MLIDQRKLQFYVKKNLNVLFEGERGVGKTSIIYKTFNDAQLKLKYFSAPTMDPWTDLVGVPTTVTRADGKEVLRMVPPEDFADDKYDAIFIDELNRAPPKVLDALMELIQFRTINGKPYNIKMIWAAINPHSEDNNDYHVEPLDKALKDRFQIQIKIPYKLDEKFFYESHGNIGKAFCEWWNNQPKDVQKEISPRRLFESIDFYLSGGDLEDIIQHGNIEKLKHDIKSVSAIQILEDDYKNKKIEKSFNLLRGNYSAQMEKFLLKDKNVFNFFLPYLNDEWISKEFLKNITIKGYLLDNAEDESSPNNKKSISIVQSIVQSAPKGIIKKHVDEFSKFLSEEQKTEFSNLPKISNYPIPTDDPSYKNSIYIPSLYSDIPNVKKFLSLMKPIESLLKESYIQRNLPITKELNKFDRYLYNQLSESYKKNKDIAITNETNIIGEMKDEIEKQIVYKFAFYLAYTRQICKIETHGAQKLFDITLNKNNPSNFFKPTFEHLIPQIQENYEKLLHFSPAELKEEFIKSTTKPKVIKKPGI